ncbi:MAG TPA: hypothetical protein VLG76_00995 [Rhabdochlamydiaceae bacterium]|nr:hypothetical protein [Rhabdochlamydiaceae bacterium]
MNLIQTSAPKTTTPMTQLLPVSLYPPLLPLYINFSQISTDTPLLSVAQIAKIQEEMYKKNEELRQLDEINKKVDQLKREIEITMSMSQPITPVSPYLGEIEITKQ